MKGIVSIFLSAVILTGFVRFSCAEDSNTGYTGKISSAVVLQTAKDYVNDKLKKAPTFNLADPEMKTTWQMYLMGFDKKVGRTKDGYYSSALFRDINTNWMLRLDFFVIQNEEGVPEVDDVKVREVAGKVRYTFDKEGNIVPAKK